jgi:tRNA G18 (ribose-2'-O)-methylase SpoU
LLIAVDDAADPRLVDYVNLRHVPDRSVVIVEGITALSQVPGSRFPLRSVLCLPRHEPRVRAVVGADATVFIASDDVLRETVGFNMHRGIVAAVERPPAIGADEVVATARVIAVLERLNDVENLGALFRNARAFGVDGVLLDAETADPLNRRTVRVSLGHVLRVPFARLESWPPSLPDFRLVALTPAGEVDLHEVPPGPRTALLFGSEGDGLTAPAIAGADVRAHIPMAPGVDSLNVATAAAIAFHHLSRPRNVAHPLNPR